jgi:hypothetical protein
MNFSFKLMTRRHDDVLERIAAAVRRVNAEVSRCAVELACAQNTRKCVKLRLLACDLCYRQMRRKVQANCTVLQQPHCGQRWEGSKRVGKAL